MNTLPFNVVALEEFMEVFHLPHEFMDKVLGVNYAMFRWCEDATRVCWVIRYNFGIAVISYSLEENLVTGLVMEGLGTSTILKRNLQTSRACFCHPMLAPTLLLTECLYSLDLWLNQTHSTGILGKVTDLEKKVGLREYFRENEYFLQQAEEALREGTDLIFQISNGWQKTKTVQDLSESVLKAIRYIDDEAKSMDTKFPSFGPTKSARRFGLERSAKSLGDRVDILIVTAESLRRSLDSLREISALQTSALFTLLTQRDSRANLGIAKDSARLASAAKRDSSSMKTIAILTTVFLPGTFVSALFSTPMVESDPSNFWVYWAITLPLTGLVIGIWATWTYWSDRRNKVRDEEAADAVGESGEGKRKGTKSEKND